MIFSHQTFPGFTVDREPRVDSAKSEITYLLFSIDRARLKATRQKMDSLVKNVLLVNPERYYFVHC